MYMNRIECLLKCDSETLYIDTQEHILQCSLLKTADTLGVTIQNAFENIGNQETDEHSDR